MAIPQPDARSCDHQVSKSSLSPSIVASGVDALYLSGRGELVDGVLGELAEKRDRTATALPATMDLGPLPFTVSGRAFGKYRYCLENPIGRVGLSPSEHLPALRVQPRSKFLHGVGPTRAVAVFADLLAPICHDLRFSVSRVDLYADVTNFPLTMADRERFVCRADSRRSYERAGQCTGFDFGARGRGSLHGRVYDKLTDVARTGHDWWVEIWNDRPGRPFDASRGVIRIELEFPRKVLTDFDLDTPEQVLAGRSSLWKYGTADWLTLRIPTADSNRSRWPLDPLWPLVQTAPLGGTVIGLERLTARARSGSLRRLTPGLVGYLAGFAALVEANAIGDTVEALEEHVRNDEIVRGVSFAERIERRRLDGGRT